MLKVIKVDGGKYDDIVDKQKVSFLQRSSWAKFKEKVSSYSPEYYLIYEDGKAIGGFLALKKVRKFFRLSFDARYIPRTVFFFEKDKMTNSELLREVLVELKKLKSSLTIVEFDYPYWFSDFPPENKYIDLIRKVSSDLHLTYLDRPVQPAYTVVKSTMEDDLISSFPSSSARRNCRWGIKRAEKRKIEFVVKEKLSNSELEEAHRLIKMISEKKRFKGRTYAYFKALQDIVPEVIWFILVDRMKKGKIILANIGILDRKNSTFIDLYVGRDVKYDKFYLHYALKYFSFNYLKSIGVKYYDHWGIELDKSSPLYGYSSFKLRFGGRIIKLPGMIILGNPFLRELTKVFRRVIYL
uniref:Peptidoglycan bridge formation glycyltransferase FemA/FemB family protein n=1 Tax=candidate division CPR3 bacterium TaxID=2268181 RepID=A0A7C5YRR8_UNCC3